MKSKILLSLLVIVFAISMVVGGTYSIFTAGEQSMNNRIQVGTLQINGDYVAGSELNGKLIDFIGTDAQAVVQPGFIKDLNIIKIENTGTLRFTLDSTVTFSGDDGNMWYIYPIVKFNGVAIDSYLGTAFDGCMDGNIKMTIAEFKTMLEGYINNTGSGPFYSHGDYYEIGGKIELDRSAGNEYQGSTFNLGISFAAEQVG